mgnify:CR=1 FL=1
MSLEMADVAVALISQPPKLLDQLRARAIEFGHPASVAESFVTWSRQYILFHGTRHPRELHLDEIGRFLEHVAGATRDPPRMIEEARTALVFLYSEVLRLDLGEFPRARPPKMLDRMRQVLRVRHYSPRTEESYVQWAKRYILFHGTRHPRDRVARLTQVLRPC